MAKCSKVDGTIVMEPTLLFTFGVLTFLCAIVAIDEMLERRQILGEEWDFVTPNNRRKT
jgi:hypothetical protein